jgi:hypothetical protein
VFATAAGELTAPGALFAAMRDRDRRCGKVSEVCDRKIGGEVGRLGNGSRGRVAVVCAMPSNKPLQRTTPPQGHWCNINGPLVRRARR